MKNEPSLLDVLLSRLQWHELTAEHAQWLTTDSVVRLVDAVKPWATTAIDYASLLEYMEDQEADSIDLASRRIAGTAQALRFARNASAIEVSDALNAYYRNANVRLAISKQMLNRVLPQVQPKTIPVRASVLGSRVTGTSHVNSSLSVDLRPSTTEWSIDLLTRGNVQTNSTGLSGPVAVRTNSRSLFNSVTPINIARDGVTVNPSDVNVSGQNRLRGIRTDYDGWPLIGTLVRSIAESRFEEMRPKATRIANRRVRASVSQEITGEVDAKVDAASEKFAKVVLGPLGDMDLNPSVVDLETTENRLLARYRVAGDWQLGSFTPRPRAPGDSLMSLQIHQTALNNTIEQLVPQGESVSIERMLRDGMISFGKEPDQITLPSELPSDVSIQFAGTRPVTIEIEDGKMYLTLRIVRLSQQNGVDLRRFIVKAKYVPQVNGLNAQLVRSGHLRISGPGMSMRERLPLRAIFNKVLAESRTFPLTMPQLLDHPAAEGLVVSQLELRDGWIGLAISEKNEIDKVAVMGLSRR